MSSLSALDKAKLEDVFEMQGGYVGNYNNQSFRNFIIRTSGIDVYTGEYENGWYPSIAKKLRRFIEIESDMNVGKVLLALLDDRDAYWKRRTEYYFGDDEEDRFADDAHDLREVAMAMIGGQEYATNEERLNADLATAKAVLKDLIFTGAN